MTDRTQPRPRFPRDYTPDSRDLAAGRYGTKEMIDIWGPEKTFEYCLRAISERSATLADMDGDITPLKVADEMKDKASLKHISAGRIREIEEKTGHDVIAITRALEEILSDEAKPHCGEISTSADTTQPARALQLKDSLEVIATSAENLRDILLEQAMAWRNVPHMDCTHLYDALPTVAGRPLAHYAEMLQSGLGLLKFVYQNSLIGKWGDATGNHHSAVSIGVNGMELQEEFCLRLGIGHMVAAAQVPGLEFEADVAYAMARLGETINNIANYVAWGRSDDVNVFRNTSPQRKKGSSAMPHKDAKNGNPTAEEQFMSIRNYLAGNLTTALMNCQMPYARNLAASANARVNFEDGFKFLDHGIRSMANLVFWIGLNEGRCIERVQRSYGVVTSQQVMNYLTDSRKVSEPLPRSVAHDMMARLATEAWLLKVPFIDVLKKTEEVTQRIPLETLTAITDPMGYVGQSKEIIHEVANRYYGRKTFGARVS